MARPTDMHAILKQGELGSLLVELQKIKTLNQIIKPLLPEQFRECSQVSRIEKGCVTLDVPNGSMATLLRYELPTILSELRKNKDWLGLVSIRPRVKAIENSCKDRSEIDPRSTDSAPAIRKVISGATREHLEQMADDIADDELRAALRALVSHI